MRTTYPKKIDLINKRKQLNLSRQEVAKFLGISKIYYEKIEYGERILSLDLAYNLSKYFNIEIKKLLNQ